MGLAAVLTDLGDVIMQEETEVKVDDVTQQAEIFPGMADLLRWLHEQGIPLALVADTRDGTYRNVLRQHGLFNLFAAFAISDHLGVVKPDRRMFEHALEALGIAEPEWPQVVMVGNNLARDIRGANALGLTSVWIAWNQRYPVVPVDEPERPHFQVHSAAELARLLDALRGNQDTSGWRYPQPFPWDV